MLLSAFSRDHAVGVRAQDGSVLRTEGCVFWENVVDETGTGDIALIQGFSVGVLGSAILWESVRSFEHNIIVVCLLYTV